MERINSKLKPANSTEVIPSAQKLTVVELVEKCLFFNGTRIFIIHPPIMYFLKFILILFQISQVIFSFQTSLLEFRIHSSNLSNTCYISHPFQFDFINMAMYRPNTVAARSEARNVFSRSKQWTVCSHLTRGMNVCCPV